MSLTESSLILEHWGWKGFCKCKLDKRKTSLGDLENGTQSTITDRLAVDSALSLRVDGAPTSQESQGLPIAFAP